MRTAKSSAVMDNLMLSRGRQAKNVVWRLVLVLATCAVPISSHSAAQPIIIPAPPQLAASAFLLIDADSGKTLVEHNSRQRLPPSSLTKIMTSYIAAGEIANRRLAPADNVLVSVRAWRMGGSKMFIREGTEVTVEELLKGVVIQSGNDASVAIAEHIAGSEDAFADIMNQQARLLGMADSNFRNASGWPDDEHYTSARDLATLTQALIQRHPKHYAMYSEKSYTYNEIFQENRNLLLWRDRSVDGVKTGYTEAGGYSLVSSAVRDGMRLISVVMGTSSMEARARQSQKLLSYGFRYYATHTPYRADESLRTLRVWGGETGALGLGVAEDVTITVPRGAVEQLTASMDLPPVVQAPLAKGDETGKLTVMLGEEVVWEGPLVALQDIPEAGAVGGMLDGISLFFLELFGGDPLAL